MELQVLQVLALCMQAKEKGHDCFLQYVPHVNIIELQIFKNGWKKDNGSGICMNCKLESNKYGETIAGVQEVTIEMMIDYLENLIKEETND